MRNRTTHRDINIRASPLTFSRMAVCSNCSSSPGVRTSTRKRFSPAAKARPSEVCASLMIESSELGTSVAHTSSSFSSTWSAFNPKEKAGERARRVLVEGWTC